MIRKLTNLKTELELDKYGQFCVDLALSNYPQILERRHGPLPDKRLVACFAAGLTAQLISRKEDADEDLKGLIKMLISCSVLCDLFQTT